MKLVEHHQQIVGVFMGSFSLVTYSRARLKDACECLWNGLSSTYTTQPTGATGRVYTNKILFQFRCKVRCRSIFFLDFTLAALFSSELGTTYNIQKIIPTNLYVTLILVFLCVQQHLVIKIIINVFIMKINRINRSTHVYTYYLKRPEVKIGE